MDLSSKRIVFVTGKGGVGKSVVAAGIAMREAKRGRKVLLAELGSQSFIGPFFGAKADWRPTPFQKNLDLALWDSDTCLREYVLYFLKVESLYKVFFDNKIMKTFLNIAPALRELAILGKVTSSERNVGPPMDYDLIVVDSFATGHTLALLRTPGGMSTAISKGPMGEQSRDMQEVLFNSGKVEYVIATLADELPTIEALELHEHLKEEFSIEASVVCNRVVTPPNEIVEILEDPGKFENISSSESGYRDFVLYLKTVTDRQARNFKRFTELGKKIYRVPHIYEAEDNISMMNQIVEHLEEPWTNS